MENKIVKVWFENGYILIKTISEWKKCDPLN